MLIDILKRPDIPRILARILYFLHKGLNKNLMICASRPFDVQLCDHPCVQRFVKATGRLRPALKSRSHPGAHILCTPDSLWASLDSFPAKILPYKKAFLVAIISARRVWEITAIFAVPNDTNILELWLGWIRYFLPKSRTFIGLWRLFCPLYASIQKIIKRKKCNILDVRRLEVTIECKNSSQLFVQCKASNKGQFTSRTV